MLKNPESSLYYTAQGEGDPVILLHGITASHYDWEALVPVLANVGYRAIAVDLPGHGDSDKPDEPDLYHWQDVYSSLEQWLALLHLPQAPVLVGHSLGGYFSLQYCLEHPGAVKALVLINPFYSPRQLSPLVRLLNRRSHFGGRALGKIPEWVLHTVMGWDPASRKNFSPEARQQIVSDLKRASPHVLRIPRTVQDLTTRLHEVDAPSLVIWGENDLTLNPLSFPNLVDLIPVADSHSIQDCGHQPHIGEPELVNDLILQFLSRTNGFSGKRGSG